MGIIADGRIAKVVFEQDGERFDTSTFDISGDKRLWLYVKDKPTQYQANYRIVGLSESQEEVITFE